MRNLTILTLELSVTQNPQKLRNLLGLEKLDFSFGKCSKLGMNSRKLFGRVRIVRFFNLSISMVNKNLGYCIYIQYAFFILYIGITPEKSNYSNSSKFLVNLSQKCLKLR